MFVLWRVKILMPTRKNIPEDEINVVQLQQAQLSHLFQVILRDLHLFLQVFITKFR